MGIGVVEHDQVDGRQQFRLGHVARAIGDDAVGQFEQPLDAAGGAPRLEAQELPDGVGQEDQAFEPAADDQEAPAVVAGHVVHGEAGQRRPGEQHLVEEGQRLAERRLRLGVGLQLVLQPVERVPVVEREALAHLGADPQQAPDAAGQSVIPFGAAQGCEQLRFDLAPRRCLAFGFRQQFQRHTRFVGGNQCRRIVVGAGVDQARQAHAQQAGSVLAALGVTSEPEEILDDARRQVAAAAHQVRLADQRLDQAERAGRFVAEDPGVLARAAALHGDEARVGRRRDAREAAGHHPVALRRGGHVHAQCHAAWQQAAFVRRAPGGRLRETHQFLRDVGMRPGAHALDHFLALRPFQLAAEDRVEVLRRERPLDDQPVQVLEHEIHGRLFAAPPRSDRGHAQRLAEQFHARAGQESGQRGRFEQAAAQGVGHQHLAGAYRLQQAGDAQCRIAAQFERVAEIIVEATQDGMHAAQPGQGLQIDAVAAHRQILAFDQRIAEIAGQVGVLEVGLVVRAGREQDDQRGSPVASLGSPLRQTVLQRAEERRQVLYAEFAEFFGKQTRHDDPVLQRITGTGGRLRAVGDNPPAAVRRAGEVGGVKVQPGVAGRAYTLAWPEKAVVSEHQRRRQVAVLEQVLRAVQIAEQRVEQSGALGDGERNLVPFRLREDHRQRVEFPRPVGALRIGIDVVGDPVLQDPPPHVVELVPHLRRGGAVQMVEERTPGRTQLPVFGEHLVEAVGLARVVREQGARHGSWLLVKDVFHHGEPVGNDERQLALGFRRACRG